MQVKPLTVCEWLERERASGLPHADFAAEALQLLNEQNDLAEARDDMLDRINRATGDLVDHDDQIVEAFTFRHAVLSALNDAGVADGDVTGDQAAGLLRMFLPI